MERETGRPAPGEHASTPPGTTRALVFATLAAFATFGSFWGVWGASIPRVRDQAGVSDGQLGLALLCVGAGALPAMLLVGRAIDRLGLRVAAVMTAALGLAGLAVAETAHGLASMSLGLLVVGMASGAADVAMNSVAGRAEQLGGRPIITRAHGVLSAFVVLGGLGCGVAAGAGLPLAAPFAVVALVSLLAAVAMARTLGGPVAAAAGTLQAGDEAPDAPGATGPLLLVGVLGALAFASESGHQNWSALFARDVLHAGNGHAALAPALFATVVAITRLSAGGLGAAHAMTVLVAGGCAAATGTVLVAAAHGTATFVVGLAIAAAGCAVLFPTVLGLVSRNVAEERRGRATSLVTTVSYLGFLLGPAYVGAIAGLSGLRTAMVAVAALSLVLVVLARPLLRMGGFRTRR